MILSKKFSTAKKFITFIEKTYGTKFDVAGTTAWYKENPSFFVTYTGLLSAVTPFKLAK